MNSINLVGRLTRDPELRETKGDTKVADIRLAVPRRNKDQDPVYVDVTAFGKLAEICNEHLAKGRRVAVSGRLEYSGWTDKDGGKHSKHEVVADQVEFLDSPQNGSAAAAEEDAESK